MKILHYVPYQFLFPPTNGGTLRSFNIARELSQHHEVDLFVAQKQNEVKAACLQGFNKINIFCPQAPLPAITLPGKIVNAVKYRFLTRQYFASADGVFLSLLPVLKERLATTNYDVVIFEHLQAMMTAPFFRHYLPHAYFILDAHNVDYLLMAEENKKQPIAGFKKRYERTKKYESSLAGFVDGYWACSQEDIGVLRSLNKQSLDSAVIANGVDTKEKAFIQELQHEDRLSILFCGDLNTVANYTGLVWFLENVWPLLKSRNGFVTLTIVGSGSEKDEFVKYRNAPEIIFKGRVDDLATAYLHAFVSIAPLQVGSGTRLKMLESLSYGVPVVATRKAAEGVSYEDGVQVMLADSPAEFCEKIICLHKDKNRYLQMRTAGRRFVELHYDWNVIGSEMEKFISMTKSNI